MKLIPNRESVLTVKEQEEFYMRHEVQAIIPVTRNYWGYVLYTILSILSLGLFALILIWRKKLWISVKFRKKKIELATHVIVISAHGEEILLEKHLQFNENGDVVTVLYYQHMKYIYDEEEFIMQRNALKLLHTEIHEMAAGIHSSNYELMAGVFGPNSTKVEVDSILKVFTEEALSSFNVYQLFACIVWYNREYPLYASIILVFVFVSIAYQIYLIRREKKKINMMAVSVKVKVFRQRLDKWTGADHTFPETVDSETLVPGDVIEVPQDEKVPCDLVLLQGQCLVDESLLTGESVPVLKSALPCTQEMFNEENRENIMYSGTRCLTSSRGSGQTERALAIVYQTGFGTTKGRLIRSIMFNDAPQYRFERDSNRFILYLFCVATVFMLVYYVIVFTQYDIEDANVW